MRRHRFWLLIVIVWTAALYAAWQEAFLLAIVLVVLNFELVKRNPVKPAFFEYVNAGLLFLLMYSPISDLVTFGFRRRPFSGQIILLVEIVVVLAVNWRYRLVSLSTLAQFLLVATLVEFLFHIWQDAYVPRNSVKGYSLPLTIYNRWMWPVETVLIAAPFLFSALAGDVRTARKDAASNPRADAYYSYAIPVIAFGLFPGVGRSFQANCEIASSYVAIGGIVALIAGSFALALALDRKSILIAGASTTALLAINRCVWTPLPVVVPIVAIAMLVSWRWMSVCRLRPA